MPLNMIVCAPKCEGSRISLWFSNVHHLEIIQKQFVVIPSLAKPHMRQGFCTLVLSYLQVNEKTCRLRMATYRDGVNERKQDWDGTIIAT